MVRTVLDKIVWDEERPDQAEAAWEKLGLHLELVSTRRGTALPHRTGQPLGLERERERRDRAEDQRGTDLYGHREAASFVPGCIGGQAFLLITG
jgi:hypothetical protein